MAINKTAIKQAVDTALPDGQAGVEPIKANGTRALFKLLIDTVAGWIEGVTQQSADWNAGSGPTSIANKPTIPVVPGVATQAVSGLMSGTDKAKLDALSDEGIQDIVGSFLQSSQLTGVTMTYDDTNNRMVMGVPAAGMNQEQIQDMMASFLTNGSSVTLSYNDAGDTLQIAVAAPGNATTTTAGLMSPTDKAKLDGVGAGANAKRQTIDAGSVNTNYVIDLTNFDDTYLKMTVIASVTLTITGAAWGKALYIDVMQGGAGSFTLTFPASVVWPTGQAVSWNTAVNGVNTFALVCSTSSVIRGNSTKY